MKKRPTILWIVGLAMIALPIAQSVSAQTRTYRGAIGNAHIQMQLNFAGRTVTGTYAYDTVGEDLRLNGVLDEQGRLELTELAPKGKQKTGKFVCKRFNDALDQECSWSRPDGTRESIVILEEQYMSLNEGLKITPKTIVNRRTNVIVSYPQIAGTGPLSAGAMAFNKRILALAQKAIGEFEPVDGRGNFDANYNILLASNDLISAELSVYFDGGGAHPNNYFLSLTYDLRTGKEIQFEDLFQPGTDYRNAIANYLVPDIDKRATALEQRYQTQPQPATKRDEPIIAADQLTEVEGFGFTPKGLVVYFDFPHVIAAFDKNIVPYSVIKQYLKPDGPAAQFK